MQADNVSRLQHFFQLGLTASGVQTYHLHSNGLCSLGQSHACSTNTGRKLVMHILLGGVLMKGHCMDHMQKDGCKNATAMKLHEKLLCIGIQPVKYALRSDY